MVQSLKIYETLKSADVAETSARAITEAIEMAFNESEVNQAKNLATKVDTANFKVDMHEIRATIRQEGIAVRAEMAKLIAESKSEVIRWLFVLLIGQVVIMKLLK